ncbi:MAG TPA: Uma2 family endonuclease [Bryobacteraceae bacterium]|nr:Uma2 family endonuclease [Bryobacteraceae bacterium]
MGATTTLVTVQEFLQLPEPDGQSIELIGGELVTMGAGKIPHEVVKKNLIRILALWLAQNSIGELFAETMYHLDEHNALIPDMSVLFPGRIPPGSTEWIQGAPEIAIEVVSSETALRLETKIDLYLAHGGKSVWVVFPDRRLVRIFDATGQARKFEQHQTLEDSSVLPGFSIPVSSLFEGL